MLVWQRDIIKTRAIAASVVDPPHGGAINRQAIQMIPRSSETPREPNVIAVYHISAAGSVIDDGNDENMEEGDEDEGDPTCL